MREGISHNLIHSQVSVWYAVRDNPALKKADHIWQCKAWAAFYSIIRLCTHRSRTCVRRLSVAMFWHKISIRQWEKSLHVTMCCSTAGKYSMCVCMECACANTVCSLRARLCIREDVWVHRCVHVCLYDWMYDLYHSENSFNVKRMNNLITFGIKYNLAADSKTLVYHDVLVDTWQNLTEIRTVPSDQSRLSWRNVWNDAFCQIIVWFWGFSQPRKRQ